MRTIMVAGGAGFLGARLCEFLLMTGARVICVDNLQTGSLAQIERLREHPEFGFVALDICDPSLLRHLRVDEIYNLACPGTPAQYRADPVRTLKTLVQGTANLLDLACINNAKFLLASSASVYGETDVSPQPETLPCRAEPISSRACHDEGKRAAETLTSDYHRQYGVPVRIARIFDCYGPGMALGEGRVIGRFIDRALAGGDLVLFGEGVQRRSFCYRDDMVEGLIRLMNGSDGLYLPVNLGGTEEVSIQDLAQMIVRIAGSPSRIEARPRPAGLVMRRMPDLTRARTHLQFSPRITLTEGLTRTIAAATGQGAGRAEATSSQALPAPPRRPFVRPQIF